jgi:hypothetical protein
MKLDISCICESPKLEKFFDKATSSFYMIFKITYIIYIGCFGVVAVCLF